jgi:steroid delta-isomerase-like uncharacterized protein
MTIVQETTNKESFQRFLDASNTGDWELISKTIDEIFDPDMVLETGAPIQARGPEAIRQVFATLHRAFPDLHIAVEDVIAEGDKVASRNVVTGTHQGEYMGLPPTGKTIAYREIFVLRFANGRITEVWGVVDVLAQMNQLGLVHV